MNFSGIFKEENGWYFMSKSMTSKDIETQSIGEFLRYMNDENREKLPMRLNSVHSEIEKVTAVLYKHSRKEIDWFIWALAFWSTWCSGHKWMPTNIRCITGIVVGIIAGGDYALRNAIEGAEDDETLAEAQLRTWILSRRDVVIGISASGRTPYVAAGLAYADTVGCFTSAISNSPNAFNLKSLQLVSSVTGPEDYKGSTRMKAGTAQNHSQYDYDCDDQVEKSSKDIWSMFNQRIKVEATASNILARLPIFLRRRKTCSWGKWFWFKSRYYLSNTSYFCTSRKTASENQ